MPGRPFCEFMNKQCIYWTYNDRQLEIYSVLCVDLIACFFFAIYKSYGHDMHRIVCAFADNTMLNDRSVDRFVRKLK